MKYRFFSALLLWFLVSQVPVAAQTPEADSLPAPAGTTTGSYVEFSSSYISDIVFAGRKDSVAVPYLSPAIGWYHSSGLFAQSSISLLTTAKENRLDLFTLTAGYQYNRGQVAAGGQFTKYFFSEGSYNVQSSISSYASAYMGYNLKDIVTIYGDAMLGFGRSTDFFTGAEISRPFYALRDQLQITPSFYAFFGTQNYYNEYYTYRRYGAQRTGVGGQGNGPGNGNGTTTVSGVVVEQSGAFRLLSLELSLPVQFTLNRFRLFVNPVYVLPQSPYTINTNGIPSKEVLAPACYGSAGISYRLGKEAAGKRN